MVRTQRSTTVVLQIKPPKRLARYSNINKLLQRNPSDGLFFDSTNTDTVSHKPTPNVPLLEIPRIVLRGPSASILNSNIASCDIASTSNNNDNFLNNYRYVKLATPARPPISAARGKTYREGIVST